MSIVDAALKTLGKLIHKGSTPLDYNKKNLKNVIDKETGEEFEIQI
jgi:hypothetical protein